MTYVLMDDGIYRKNPTFYGAGWYLTVGDDEEPRYTIKLARKTGDEIIYKNIRKQMRESGIKGVINKGEGIFRSNSAFPPHYAGYKQAASVILEIRKPLPAVLPSIHAAIVMDIGLIKNVGG